MKISKIRVSNVLRISDVSIESTAPVILVAGANEAGKSSLLDAIACAMHGKLPRVELKKNLGEAVHLGKENGFVEVSTDGGDYSVTLPSGKGVQAYRQNIHIADKCVRQRHEAVRLHADVIGHIRCDEKIHEVIDAQR